MFLVYGRYPMYIEVYILYGFVSEIPKQPYRPIVCIKLYGKKKQSFAFRLFIGMFIGIPSLGLQQSSVYSAQVCFDKCQHCCSVKSFFFFFLVFMVIWVLVGAVGQNCQAEESALKCFPKNT